SNGARLASRRLYSSRILLQPPHHRPPLLLVRCFPKRSPRTSILRLRLAWPVEGQNEATFAMFQQVCGDLPVTAYTRSHLSDFYNVLRGLPALYSKDKRWPREDHVRARARGVRRRAGLGRLGSASGHASSSRRR